MEATLWLLCSCESCESWGECNSGIRIFSRVTIPQGGSCTNEDDNCTTGLSCVGIEGNKKCFPLSTA